MRHSRADKQRSHQRIVEVASRRIREAGTEAPSVAEIMESAGMTHGGFYKHFGSRDELIAEAAAQACADGAENLRVAMDGAEDPLAAFLASYLSPEHRDMPASGCGVTALSGDAARPGNPARDAYTAQVRQYLDLLERLLPATGSAGEDRDAAIVATSTFLGALIMARGVNDPALSEEILSAVRRSVVTPSA